MESSDKLRLKLTEVASKLDSKELEKLKYLCVDYIPPGDLEKINTPEQLFLKLEQRKKIEPSRLEFLIERLGSVGRKDLADDLKSCECEGAKGE